MSRTLLLLATASTALLMTLAVASPALANGPRPFKSDVTAVWDNVFSGFNPETPATFIGGGPTSHMGHTFQTGTLVFDGPPAEIIPGHGSVTITAANGDEISFDFEGLLYAATGEGIGTFTLTGGTGRFAGATGSGTFYALIDISQPENQSMHVDLLGEIEY
jgi:hypothetical protein